MELGIKVHDADGQPWLYFGYRTTSIGTKDHYFIKCLTGKKIAPSWTYHASKAETLKLKFPDLII
jgi:hypothetical protein